MAKDPQSSPAPASSEREPLPGRIIIGDTVVSDDAAGTLGMPSTLGQKVPLPEDWDAASDET